MLPDSNSAPITLETELFVSKMDCPSEENLIRMALGRVSDIDRMAFDLSRRTVTVVHRGTPETLVDALQPLGLGVELRQSRSAAVKAARTTSTLGIPKMDCPSEENMIRMALSDVADIKSLNFDLAQRQLHVTHTGSIDPILSKLIPLEFGANLIVSAAAKSEDDVDADRAGDQSEAKTLRWLLAINGAMFVAELVWGLIAQSAGLVADSLDMFADAAVYGLALYAVGRAASLKTRAAHVAGWLHVTTCNRNGPDQQSSRFSARNNCE